MVEEPVVEEKKAKKVTFETFSFASLHLRSVRLRRRSNPGRSALVVSHHVSPPRPDYSVVPVGEEGEEREEGSG